MVVGADRQPPVVYRFMRTQLIDKREKAIDYVSLRRRFNAFIDEPVLTITRTLRVETDAPARAHQSTDAIGAPAGVHVQQDFEAFIAQLPAQRLQARPTGPFIHDKK